MYYLSACPVGSALQVRQASASGTGEKSTAAARRFRGGSGDGRKHSPKGRATTSGGGKVDSEQINTTLTKNPAFRELRKRWHTASQPHTTDAATRAGGGMATESGNNSSKQQQNTTIELDEASLSRMRQLKCRQGLVRESPCGLCEVPFLRSCLVTSVSRHSVLELRDQWAAAGSCSGPKGGSKNTPQRPSALYTSVQLCRYCSQFVNVYLGERFPDEASQPMTYPQSPEEVLRARPATAGGAGGGGSAPPSSARGGRPLAEKRGSAALRHLSALRRLISDQGVSARGPSSSSSSEGEHKSAASSSPVKKTKSESELKASGGKAIGTRRRKEKDDGDRSSSSQSSRTRSHSTSTASEKDERSSSSSTSPSTSSSSSGSSSSARRESPEQRKRSTHRKPGNAADKKVVLTSTAAVAAPNILPTVRYIGNRASQLRREVAVKRKSGARSPAKENTSRQNVQGPVADFFVLGDEPPPSGEADTMVDRGGSPRSRSPSSSSPSPPTQSKKSSILAKESRAKNHKAHDRVVVTLPASPGHAGPTPSSLANTSSSPSHSLSGSVKVLILCCSSYTTFPPLPRAIHASTQVFTDWCEQRLGVTDLRCYRDDDVSLSRVESFARDCGRDGSIPLVAMIGHQLAGYAPASSGETHLVLTTRPEAAVQAVHATKQRTSQKKEVNRSIQSSGTFAADVTFRSSSVDCRTLGVSDIFDCFQKHGIQHPTVIFDCSTCDTGNSVIASSAACRSCGLFISPSGDAKRRLPFGGLLHHVIESCEDFLAAQSSLSPMVTVLDVLAMWRDRAASMNPALQSLFAQDIAEDKEFTFVMRIVGQHIANEGEDADERKRLLFRNLVSRVDISTPIMSWKNQGRVLGGEKLLLMTSDKDEKSSSCFGFILAACHVSLSVPSMEWDSVAQDIRQALAIAAEGGGGLKDLHISFSTALNGCVAVFVSSLDLSVAHGAVLRRLRLVGRLRYRIARCGFIASSANGAKDETGMGSIFAQADVQQNPLLDVI